MRWIRRHINFVTFIYFIITVFAPFWLVVGWEINLLIGSQIPYIIFYCGVPIVWLVTSASIILAKRRSLWWLLLGLVFSPMWLEDKSKKEGELIWER